MNDKENKIFRDFQLGKFRMELHFLKNTHRDVLRKIMGDMVILRAKYLFGGVIEYTAYSEHFDPVPRGKEVPEYEVFVEETSFDGIGMSYHITYEKIEK